MELLQKSATEVRSFDFGLRVGITAIEAGVDPEKKKGGGGGGG